jgi:cellulose synthase/poly-beta-1,6-N-acetylglucosamine synthase-like glycosyltransferase
MSAMVVVLQFLVAAYAAALALAVLGLTRRPASPVSRDPAVWPDIDVVVPARDEGTTLTRTIASLAAQEYPGRFTVWIVDDRSHDDTFAIACAAAERDARFRALRVTAPSKTMAPKVHAVWHGIRAGRAPWIATTDVDCVHPPGWLRSLMDHAAPGVVMVLGHVATPRPRGPGLLGRYEALDWLSLMFVSRALTRLGWTVVSSANNQAYARYAFEAVGGFGVAGRAPSGDEDLLAQRLRRQRGARFAFADEPQARVTTDPQPTWRAFLRQRRRWVSRYHHLQQYHPLFLAWVAFHGLTAVAVGAAVLAAPFAGAVAGALLAPWGVKVAVETVAMHVGLLAVDRRDLLGWPVVAWAALHPFVVGAALVGSFLQPASWRAGARHYRRRLWRVTWRRRRGPSRP